MKTLQQFIDEDVNPMKTKDFGWLASEHFLRDPKRANRLDSNFFFAPADGVIIYQRKVKPDEPLVEMKGINYTLKEVFQDPDFNKTCYVIGIFMTFYNVHINRIPYSGSLTYQELPPILSHNLPMLNEENKLLENIVDFSNANYMFHNQRMISTVFSPRLKQEYYLVRLADFDVDCIVNHNSQQNYYYHQNERFGQIRFGSQTDLIIPESSLYNFDFVLETTNVVEAGLDTLIKITPK